jgi:hypothetical protein
MKELNNKLDGLSELVTRIDAKILDINTKLDELIKALHEYDDENNLHCEYSGLPSVMAYDETIANERMDIIGQNGNEGSHYVTNEEADEDAKSNNTQTKRVGEKKKRDKWVSPYPPNPKRKSAIVEHEKHPPHKH